MNPSSAKDIAGSNNSLHDKSDSESDDPPPKYLYNRYNPYKVPGVFKYCIYCSCFGYL